MKHGIVIVVRCALIAAATVLLAEGLSSIILFVSSLHSPGPALAERRHTRYDPEIGWVNIPGLRLPGMYGPGVSLTIDGSGARAAPGRFSPPPAGGKKGNASICAGGYADDLLGRVVGRFYEAAFFSPARRAGLHPPATEVLRRRIVCSGDSFTLGFGVGDGQAWPAALCRLQDRWETVNLGQGGYDLGQSYLWFRRVGEGRAYDLHLLALTPPLLERMRSTVFLGYGKPRMNASGGELVVENVPVPRRPFFVPWLNENRGAFAGLRLAALIGKLRRVDSPEVGALLSREEAEKTAAYVLRDLSTRARRQGGALAVAFLPLRGSYDLSSPESWQRFIREETKRQGLAFLDLAEEMRKLPRERVETFYVPEGAVAYPYAAGHYSAAGNAWVAEVIGEKLAGLGY